MKRKHDGLNLCFQRKRLAIGLDDGVKFNYLKCEEAAQPIPGSGRERRLKAHPAPFLG